MELIRHTVPFAAQEVLSLWAQTFGAAEAELERPQVDGSETKENLDILYTGRKDGVLMGTIHATIPRMAPTLCGLSGMCVIPESRGTGLGRILFTKILEEIDGQGVEAAFLGTSNPVAAKLYHSLGFSFLPGSNVMVRYKNGDTVDFTKSVYGPKPEKVTILPGSPAMRIPMIPLVLHRGKQKLLDCNAGLFSSSEVTQVSCMGLYPKYTALDGFWGAVSEAGVLGAMASVQKTELGNRADFFCCDSFCETVGQLLDACRQSCGDIYLQLAETDTEKRRIAEQLGFRAAEKKPLVLGQFTLQSVIYK